MHSELQKPSLFLYFTESLRSFIETIKGFILLWFTNKTNVGKGRVVMVIPGLLTSDFWTIVLRSFLKKKGFVVYGWELGTNLGKMEKLPLLVEKIESISKKHDQKVILIGWSMGGLFSRAVCHQIPQYIDHVITTGSPFANIHAPNNAKWVYELINNEEDVDKKLLSFLPLPTPMPSTALYSKKDGIIPWQACMDKQVDDDHRNVEVSSSHFGMGANPSVLNAVLQTLT